MKVLPLVIISLVLVIRFLLPMFEADYDLAMSTRSNAERIQSSTSATTATEAATPITAKPHPTRENEPTKADSEKRTDSTSNSEKAFGNSDGIGYTIEEFNRLTEDDLTRFRGIGPETAKAILRFRAEHGPFQSFQDLLGVKGIGEKKLRQILGKQ